MGTGTSSGKGASVKAPQWETEVDNAEWQKLGTSKSFGIPGIGGAIVRRVRNGTTWGYEARVYTPNSDASPINGGSPFASETQAMDTAKKVLKNRRRVQLQNGGNR